MALWLPGMDIGGIISGPAAGRRLRSAGREAAGVAGRLYMAGEAGRELGEVEAL